jgi:hypothetical protein
MRRTSSNRAGKNHHHRPLQVTANADRYTSSDPYWNKWGSGCFYELQAAFDAYDNLSDQKLQAEEQNNYIKFYLIEESGH